MSSRFGHIKIGTALGLGGLKERNTSIGPIQFATQSGMVPIASYSYADKSMVSGLKPTLAHEFPQAGKKSPLLRFRDEAA